jgi:UDP-2-acetamido-2,6-beta-L-arabino-hexul-4-ose reductase
MRVLITGSQGFIGKNLILKLIENNIEYLTFNRGDVKENIVNLLDQVDYIIHLAGENRPKELSGYSIVNAELTKILCNAIRATGFKIPLILVSSTQASLDNPYGKSKFAAEVAAEALANETGNPVHIYRLPGVFGKWCKPNYNSVVATYCHNIANDLPIHIYDKSTVLKLVYIDDVVSDFMRLILQQAIGLTRPFVQPEYSITLGELADQIKAFKNCGLKQYIESFGKNLVGELYSTYISYLKPKQFSYTIPRHFDERGIFVEFLKSKEFGQISFFTTHPGVTRGGHYHNSKTEKFLVIKGNAQFCFRNMMNDDTYEIFTSGEESVVVDTVPGWSHNITNVGSEEMIVMLWANEIFDQEKPDTIAANV